MSLGLTHWSNCSDVRKPSFTAASFSVVPSLCAVLAILAALSYPATNPHEEFSHSQFHNISFSHEEKVERFILKNKFAKYCYY